MYTRSLQLVSAKTEINQSPMQHPHHSIDLKLKVLKAVLKGDVNTNSCRTTWFAVSVSAKALLPALKTTVFFSLESLGGGCFNSLQGEISDSLPFAAPQTNLGSQHP